MLSASMPSSLVLASVVEVAVAASALVGTAAALLALGAALLGGYRRTIGRRRTNYGRLARLGTGAQLSFFEAVLTEPPAIKRTVDAEVPELHERRGRTITRQVKRQFVESIFIDRDYYVQTLSNDDETVLAFSVTTRSRRFKPRYVFPQLDRRARRRLQRENGSRWRPLVDLRLGQTRFVEAVPDANSTQRIKAAFGARTWAYSEIHHFGNPGYYQTYVLTASSAVGPSPAGNLAEVIEEIGHDWPATPGDWDSAELERMPGVRTFRRETAITTYTIVAPHIPADHFPTGFGPHGDDVRTLP